MYPHVMIFVSGYSLGRLGSGYRSCVEQVCAGARVSGEGGRTPCGTCHDTSVPSHPKSCVAWKFTVTEVTLRGYRE